MNNIAKYLADITIFHEHLGLSLHRGLVETLCHNSMTEKPYANMGTANAFVDLFNDSFRLVGWDTPLAW